MNLVLVHGRAQQGKDPAALKEEWLDALTYGLERANTTLPAVTSIELPYYGDLLDQLVDEIDAPLGEAINAKGPNPDPDPTLRGEIIMEIARGADVTSEDIERELEDVPAEKGPGNWEWVQAALRAIDRVPGLNARAIDRFTRDVFVYLTYPAVRKQVDRIVADAIGPEAAVVVAHSLGTVIAYNVLYRRDPAPPCPRFVTLGSPLGIRAIRARIERPLRSPPCVAAWLNAYDDRDLVALTPLDALNFDVHPPVENKSDVVNFTDNRHGITGYLADQVVARRIAEALR